MNHKNKEENEKHRKLSHMPANLPIMDEREIIGAHRDRDEGEQNFIEFHIAAYFIHIIICSTAKTRRSHNTKELNQNIKKFQAFKSKKGKKERERRFKETKLRSFW